MINIYDHISGKFKNMTVKQYMKEYKGLSSEIVQMTPNEYLEICAKESWEKEKNSPYLKGKDYQYYKNMYLKGRSENIDLINNYSKRWLGGSNPPLCYIKYYNGKYDTQEGIHRMLTAIKLGAGNKKFPVMIIYEVKKK